MVEEYRQNKQVECLVDASIYEVLLTLRHFKRIVGLSSSREVTQPNLDTFVLKRSGAVGKNTLNKDITNRDISASVYEKILRRGYCQR